MVEAVFQMIDMQFPLKKKEIVYKGKFKKYYIET